MRVRLGLELGSKLGLARVRMKVIGVVYVSSLRIPSSCRILASTSLYREKTWSRRSLEHPRQSLGWGEGEG